LLEWCNLYRLLSVVRITLMFGVPLYHLYS